MSRLSKLLAHTSLRTRMVVIFFIFDALVLLFLSAYYYNQTTKAVTKEIIQRNNAIFDNLADDLAIEIGKVSDILYRLSYNSDLRSIMKSDYSQEPEEAYRQQMEDVKLLSALVDRTTNDPIIKQVKIYFSTKRIYTEDSYKYFTFADATDKDWCEKVFQERDQICWTIPTLNINGRYPGIPILSAARTVSEWGNPENPPIGFLEVEADIRLLFNNVTRSLMKEIEGDLFLINEDGVIISALNSSDMGKNINQRFGFAADFYSEGVQYADTEVFFIKHMEEPNWYVVSHSSLASFQEVQAGIFRRIIYMLEGCFVIILVFNIILSKFLTLRLSKLQEIINQSNTSFGDNKAKKLQSRDELENISSYFMDLTGHNQYLMNEIYKAELQKKEAEINALQSQIRPHFLYNVLDSINWMAIKNGQGDISRAIRHLADYYRGRLSADSGLISLAQELNHCQTYVALMNIRFNNVLELKQDIAPDLMSANVCKMLLQPFIENSIQHGILESEERQGVIWISAKAEGGHLILTVEDDGVGISEEIAQKLNQGIVISTKGGGVGFANVSKRIKLIFGEEYGAKIGSAELGTRVTIELPLLMSSESS